MNAPTPKYDRKEIGSATVRIPSGTGMPDPWTSPSIPTLPPRSPRNVFIKGFQAWPQKGGPFPAVLMIHGEGHVAVLGQPIGEVPGSGVGPTTRGDEHGGNGPPFWGQAWKPLMNTFLATLVGA